MRAVFLGTPEFAVPSLRAVLQRHDVPLAVTQPDRRAGRGLGLRRSAVGEVAAAAGVPLLQPERVREPAVLEAVRAAEPDILVVAAYGQILPPALLEAAPHGALNVHASLLPRWRGASPVTAAILAGDDETGVSIMRMDPGLDTGPVALRRGVPIAPEDTTGSLTERLAEVGAEALVEVLEAVQSGRNAFQPQPPEGVTHAPRVRKSDGDLDWDRPAAELERALRAYDPWPGVRLPVAGVVVRVLRGGPLPTWTMPRRPAGVVVESGPAGITVMAADGPFLVAEVQPPGKRAMAASAWVRGRRDLAVGEG